MAPGVRDACKREEQVVPIRPFLKDGVFSPELVSAMGIAFEAVCVAASSRSDIAKEMIAGRIIQLAQRGETNAIVLRDTVLSELGLSPLREQP
jgi:hypothetical protein